MARSQGENQWWIVIFLSMCAFLFLNHGFVKAYGVLIPPLVIHLDTSYSVVGFISSLQITVTFLGCPVAQVLMERFGMRRTSAAGALLLSISVSCASFVRKPFLMELIFTSAGFGASMLYQATHVALKEHFGDRYGAARSLASLSALFGGMFFSWLTSRLYTAYGLQGTYLILGAIIANKIVIGLTLKPPQRRVIGQIIDNGHDAEPNQVTPMLNQENPTDDASKGDNHDINVARETRRAFFNDFRFRITDVLFVIRHALGKLFALDVLRKELLVTLLFLPCQIIHDYAFFGWALFIVSYGVSVGIDETYASYFIVAGTGGGICSRILMAFVLHRRPGWSLILYMIFAAAFAFTLFLYPLGSSFGYLMGCSFAAGFSAYGGIALYFAVLGMSVSEENFPQITAISCFLGGLAIPSTGALTGLMYDVTHSFETTFQINGGLMVIIPALCMVYYCLQLRESQRRTASTSS